MAAPAGASGEILVTRKLAGVAITARQKRAEFVGVLLQAPRPEASTGYAIVLAAKSQDQDVMLACDLDESEIVAHWRAKAAELSLPALICHADGELEALQRQLGAVTLGGARPRRRKLIVRSRRPRFLMRRKAGHALSAKN